MRIQQSLICGFGGCGQGFGGLSVFDGFAGFRFQSTFRLPRPVLKRGLLSLLLAAMSRLTERFL